jgi:hypothetical protein
MPVFSVLAIQQLAALMPIRHLPPATHHRPPSSGIKIRHPNDMEELKGYLISPSISQQH